MADSNERISTTASGQSLDQGYAALTQFLQQDRVDVDSPLRDAIAYLAAQLQNVQTGGVSLDQLPIADLQNQLSTTWHPQWTIDETNDSIMGSIIGGRVSIQTGIITATFSASTESAVATANHSLGAVPSGLAIQPIVSGTDRLVFYTGPVNGAQFQGVARNEVGVALSGNFSFRWLAIG